MKLAAPSRREGSILLVALVDVLFVLLLFFLLAAQAAKPPKLAAEWATTAIKPVETLLLLPDGRVRWRERSLAYEDAIAKLSVARVQEIELQPAPAVHSGVLLKMLAALRAADIAPILPVSAEP